MAFDWLVDDKTDELRRALIALGVCELDARPRRQRVAVRAVVFERGDVARVTRQARRQVTFSGPAPRDDDDAYVFVEKERTLTLSEQS